jgi:cell division protein FtsL
VALGENKQGGGGFSVSFSTVANGVAVLALVALCSVMWSDHSDIVDMKREVEGLDNNIKRIEATASTAATSSYQLTGEVLGLRGENDERRREGESLKDAVKDLDSRERDLERMFSPPRVDRSGPGNGRGG